MFGLRQAMKACRKARICLRCEIELRNLIIETLCYRHEIRNQMDGGHNRAQIRAGQLLASARKGTLDGVQVPPGVRLLMELEKAYYHLPGRISMAHMDDKPFPPRVYEDARKAAELVAKGAAQESLDVDE